MALCWRGTFIDLDEPVDDRSPRRRSSSTPASSRKEHFDVERSYIRTLAKRVGFPEDAKERQNGPSVADKSVSRSVGALPLLSAAPFDDDASDYEEDEDDDEFFAEWATVTEAVQSLSSLPCVRTCGTAATTMDSLCSLGDVPECDDIACCEGKLPRDFDFDTSLSIAAGPQARPRRPSCASQASSEADYATFADSFEGDACGSAPFHAGTPYMPDVADDTESEGVCSIEAPFPAAVGPNTRTAPVYGSTTEAEQQEAERLELSSPNMQCSNLRSPVDSRHASGHAETGSSCGWARSAEQCAGYAEEEWDCQAEEGQWGQEMEQEDMDQLAGGHRGGQDVSASFQHDNVVDVAFNGKVALILVGQNITSAEDADDLLWAVSTCREKGEAISAVLLWIEAAPPRGGQHDARHHSAMVMRERVAEVVEALNQLQYPVMGFASGSFGVWTTLLTAGCDQIISLASADFCMEDAGDFRAVSAERGLEMGFVARLEGSTDALLQSCSAFMDQVDLCSKDELARMKSSLRGVRSHLLVESRAPLPAQWQAVPAVPARMALPVAVAQPMGVFVAYAPYPGNQAPMSAATPVETGAACSGMGIATQEGQSSCEQDVTSLMLKNLPCRLTQQQLMNIIDSLGFVGKVDHLHFPSSKGSANPGYVFVNFVSPDDATRFTAAFKKYRFANSRTNKVPDVVPARIQGRLAMIEQFERRPC